MASRFHPSGRAADGLQGRPLARTLGIGRARSYRERILLDSTITTQFQHARLLRNFSLR
jgi:hypothetical protein